MPHHRIVDELADVRADIARLRLRERQLRAALLHATEANLQGRWHRAEVTRECRLILDPALLPAEVRNDPRYLRLATTEAVHCMPLPKSAARSRPGWPIQREAASV